MHLTKTARAILRLWIADARLAADTRRCARAGIHEQTPRNSDLSNVVDDALNDPYLPDRYRDPIELAELAELAALADPTD